MKNLLVISNDKIFFSNKEISSKFNDTINIIDALQKKFRIFLVSRKCNTKNNFQLKRKKIFKLNLREFFKIRKKQFKILMISITPRNIFFFLFLKLLKRNVTGFVYLRSDGYKEYEIKFGKPGVLFFALLMKLIDKNLKIISVSKNITAPKIDHLVNPSELDKNWFKKKRKLNINFPIFLYFGRFKKEKGIYNLINLLKDKKFKYQLTVAGDSDYFNSESPKIRYIKEISEQKKIINLYDYHNIFILPSYTEGAPKVILESLARKIPVIVFREIKHVKKDFEGIFICRRNIKSLENTARHILKNYVKIQKKMNKNTLITKQNFQNKFIKILNE